MLRLAILSLAAAWLASFHVNPAAAERRVALIVGNSAYRHVSRLPNPVNDARAVEGLFKSAGFDSVERHQDLGIADLRRVVREFAEATRDADIAVVYFAGHGIEVNGSNYLIPVDAKLASDFDVEDEALALDRVLKVLEPARRLRLVILDACRDNPFAGSMRRSLGTRSISRGLAKIEPSLSDTLIAFAAKAGSVAVDGDGTNSPFTAALVKHIASPGLDLRIAFGRVRDAVLTSTRGMQEPFVYGSLGGDTVSIVGGDAPPESRPTPPATVDRRTAERQDYEAAERIGTTEAWRSFLARHNDGFYADLARAAVTKLAALETRTPPIDRSPGSPPSSAALDSLARNFLYDYMRQAEADPQSKLAYLPRIYGRDVTYYGKPTKVEQVMSDKRRFIGRWPQQTYRPKADMIKIVCDAASSSCRISGELDYHHRAGVRTVSGTAYYEFRVVFSPSGPKIVEETGRTISRQN